MGYVKAHMRRGKMVRAYMRGGEKKSVFDSKTGMTTHFLTKAQKITKSDPEYLKRRKEMFKKAKQTSGRGTARGTGARAAVIRQQLVRNFKRIKGGALTLSQMRALMRKP